MENTLVEETFIFEQSVNESVYSIMLTIDYKDRCWSIKNTNTNDYSFKFLRTINGEAAEAITELIAYASKYAFKKLGITKEEIKEKEKRLPF